MAGSSTEEIYRELRALRGEVEELKSRFDEDFELSDWAKQRIRRYEEGDEETVSHQSVKEKFLR